VGTYVGGCYMDILKKLWGIFGGYIITITIVILCLSMFVYILKGPSQDYVQKTLTDMIEQSKIEYKIQIDNKDKELKNKDIKIKELNEALYKSKVYLEKAKSDLNKLKTEVSSINEPKDIQEIKERFKKLGYSVR
jgi:hypothetical protein